MELDERRNREARLTIDSIYEENRFLKNEMEKLRAENANLIDRENRLKNEIYDKQRQIDSLKQIDNNSEWRQALLIHLTNQEAARNLTNQAIRSLFGAHPEESEECARFIGGADCGGGFIIANDRRMSASEMIQWSEGERETLTRFSAAGDRIGHGTQQAGVRSELGGDFMR